MRSIGRDLGREIGGGSRTRGSGSERVEPLWSLVESTSQRQPWNLGRSRAADLAVLSTPIGLATGMVLLKVWGLAIENGEFSDHP